MMTMRLFALALTLNSVTSAPVFPTEQAACTTIKDVVLQVRRPRSSRDHDASRSAPRSALTVFGTGRQPRGQACEGRGRVLLPLPGQPKVQELRLPHAPARLLAARQNHRPPVRERRCLWCAVALPPLPPPPPPPSPMGVPSGPDACSPGTNGTAFKFCDKTLSMDARLDDLIVSAHDGSSAVACDFQ